VHWSPAVVTRVPTAPTACSFQREGRSSERPSLSLFNNPSLFASAGDFANTPSIPQRIPFREIACI